MDGNRRDSGCRPFYCARCNPQLVRWKAGFHGQVTQMTNLSGERRVFTDVFEKSPRPTLHAGDDLHDEKKQGRAAVGKRDEKVRADAYGEQD